MKKYAFVVIILAAQFWTGCESTTMLESSAGVISGNVALVSAIGDTLSSYAGVTVILQGAGLQTTSNAKGEWEIDDVPAGFYTILLTKPGFDSLILPKFEFKGVGTSYFVSNGIQQYPMDSLVFTITNTTEDSTANQYVGLIGMSGSVSGPDSLELTVGAISATGEINQTPALVIVDGVITNGSRGLIGYNEPPVKRGSVVTFRSSLFGNSPKIKLSNFATATSPFTVIRTLTLP